MRSAIVENSKLQMQALKDEVMRSFSWKTDGEKISLHRNEDWLAPMFLKIPLAMSDSYSMTIGVTSTTVNNCLPEVAASGKHVRVHWRNFCLGSSAGRPDKALYDSHPERISCIMAVHSHGRALSIFYPNRYPGEWKRKKMITQSFIIQIVSVLRYTLGTITATQWPLTEAFHISFSVNMVGGKLGSSTPPNTGNMGRSLAAVGNDSAPEKIGGMNGAGFLLHAQALVHAFEVFERSLWMSIDQQHLAPNKPQLSSHIGSNQYTSWLGWESLLPLRIAIMAWASFVKNGFLPVKI